MQQIPIKATVIGSYPFPGWLEFASQNLDQFGPVDLEEMINDAVVAAIHDQVEAGLDVITDGEQTRLDFNLSFYGYLEGIQPNHSETRRFGPPAHDQRGKHTIIEPIRAPYGLGVVDEYKRLQQLAPKDKILKASIPGPYTLAGRLLPGNIYKDRWEITEALLPIISKELEDLVDMGVQELCIDEPSMSCYAYKEDASRFVDIFNRTIETVKGKTRIASHLCFGNFKGRSVGKRGIAPMYPHFLELKADEIHTEMCTLNFTDLPLLEAFAEKMDVGVGIIDVKSYYIESIDDLMKRIERCLKYIPAEKLAVAPDCGLSQTARWACRLKLKNMCEAAKRMR